MNRSLYPTHPTLTERGALNSVLHTIAICQIRDGGRGQEYYLRKIAEGKTPAEARRALKRRLSNVVYRIMKRGPLPLIEDTLIIGS